MIKSISVKGLNGKLNLDVTFNRDINLFTGKNGSGKTSLMKLMWLMLKHLSVSDIEKEITFSYAQLKTDSGELICEMDNKKRNTVINDDFSSSLFFPTFRRIEGGFMISKNTQNDNVIASNLEKAFSDFSNFMSENNQRIVTSISIKDLIPLINEEYARVSEQFNKKQTKGIIGYHY